MAVWAKVAQIQLSIYSVQKPAEICTEFNEIRAVLFLHTLQLHITNSLSQTTVTRNVALPLFCFLPITQ